MKRSASAYWGGNLTEGSGTLTTPSGVLDKTPYTFKSRFEADKETNPEELIAAAHAGCFTMALSLFLGNAGFTPKTLNTTAEVSLDQVKAAWAITSVHLTLKASIPNITEEKFQELATFAKANCPVSKLLHTIEVTLHAELE